MLMKIRTLINLKGEDGHKNHVKPDASRHHQELKQTLS